MYKEVIRNIGYSIIIASMLSTFTSCNGGNSQQAESLQLFEAAQKEYNSNNIIESSKLLDSLKVSFPDDIDIQRKALHLRTLIAEKETQINIVSNDSVMNVSDAEVANLKNNFSYIKTKDMVEGYFVNKKSSPLINRTGINARIDDNHDIYIVSLVNGKSLNHSQIAVTINGKDYRSKNVPYNGTSNYRFKDGAVQNEMVTFRGPECDTLCMAINENKNANIRLSFIGNKTLSVTLGNTEKNIISETQRYSQALKASKKAHDMELYFKNKLKITQEQIKKTSVD